MGKKSNVVICLASFVALFAVMFCMEGKENLQASFAKYNYVYLLFAVICMLAYYILESIALHLCVKKVHAKQKFSSSFFVSAIGQMFNQITPFASGGQIAQGYFLAKENVKVADASAALLAKFLLYQLSLSIVSMFALLCKGSFLVEKIDGFAFLAVIGFAVNFAVLLFLLFAGFFAKKTQSVARKVISFLEKIHVIHNGEKLANNICKEVEKFSYAFASLQKEKKLAGKVAFVSTLQLLCYFALPFCIVCGMYKEATKDILLVICSSAFVHLVTSFVPSPGAMGGAEGIFFCIYGSMFSRDGILFAVFLWRIVTFYLPILFGIFLLFAKQGKLAKIPSM